LILEVAGKVGSTVGSQRYMSCERRMGKAFRQKSSKTISVSREASILRNNTCRVGTLPAGWVLFYTRYAGGEGFWPNGIFKTDYLSIELRSNGLPH
jgi:hypothetical protein